METSLHYLKLNLFLMKPNTLRLLLAIVHQPNHPPHSLELIIEEQLEEIIEVNLPSTFLILLSTITDQEIE